MPPFALYEFHNILLRHTFLYHCWQHNFYMPAMKAFLCDLYNIFVLFPFLLKSTRHAATNLCKQSDLSCMPQLLSVADKSLIDSKTAKKTQVTTD